MIRVSDMVEMKGGIHKLSMMNNVLKNIDMGVQIMNLTHLLVQNWTSRHVLDLYNAGKHFLHFLLLKKGDASRKLLGRIITIFCVLGRFI